MKKYSSYLNILASSLSILTANFAISQPAKASIVCEMDTIIYQNYQLEKCILGKNFSAKVATIQGTKYTVPCQAKSYIIFNQKGQLKSCQLSKTIRIRKGNSIDSCPAKTNISVAVSRKGNPYISCRYFR
ncbi:MAG: hypothetical protein QNJ63_08225 [Calothrix sp. MO_192.B10]|nr:hypothetical protein [Calothrix sp. MO_192.B10]